MRASSLSLGLSPTSQLEANSEDRKFKLPMSIVFSYPFHVVQSRFLCARYMRCASGYPYGTNSSLYGQTTQSTQLPYASMSMSSTSIAFPHLYQIRSVLRSSGITGLYRGFTLGIAHVTTREIIRYSLLRYCNTILEVLCTAIDMALKFSWSLLTFSWLRDSPHPPQEESSAITRIINPLSVAKYISEIISYPLLTCSTRLIVFSGPEKLGIREIFELTYLFDGYLGFYHGIIPHMICIAVSDAATYAASYVLRYTKPSPDAEKPFFLWFSTLSNVLTMHIHKLGVVQRCQSSMEGLCIYEPPKLILMEFPAKGLLVALSIASLSLLGIVFATPHEE